MKNLLCISAVIVLCGACALSADKPVLPKTVTEVFDQSVSGAQRATIAMAEAMPEDKYQFVPTNGEFTGVRNFGQLVMHVATDNYVNGAALLQEKLPIDPGQHENGPASIRTKAEILQFLRDSFAYLHTAMRTVNQKNLMGKVEFPGAGSLPRLMIVTAAIAHPWDLYGQMVEYLRMNGIDPQGRH